MIKALAASFGHLAGIKRLTPVYLILGATWRCNARCITCFNHERLNREELGELSVDEHRRTAQNMGPLLWLLFTGGEPILRRDLAEVAEVYYRKCSARRITVPTNALLPKQTLEATHALLDKCPRAGITISLALDGSAGVHDEMRGVSGAFDALLETYDLLAQVKAQRQRLSINVNTVLCNRNLAAIPDLMELVSERMPAADFHGFELLRGKTPDADLAPPSADEYERLLERLVPYWSRFPFYKGPFRRLIRAAKVQARLTELDVLRGGRFRCLAGTVAAYVAPEGRVHFCEELDRPVGELREAEYDFRKIWFGEEARRLRNFIAEKRCCCTHSCFVGSSILFDVSHYPSIMRRMIWP